jgi:hypothetical protein
MDKKNKYALSQAEVDENNMDNIEMIKSAADIIHIIFINFSLAQSIFVLLVHTGLFSCVAKLGSLALDLEIYFFVVFYLWILVFLSDLLEGSPNLR